MNRRTPPVKLYYRIGEVAEAVGVQPHVLRYWESEFGSIRPQKSARGQRVYSHKDVEKLIRVKELLHQDGYTIAGARKKLKEAESPEQSVQHERFVQEMHVELTHLRAEIQAELDSLNRGD